MTEELKTPTQPPNDSTAPKADEQNITNIVAGGVRAEMREQNRLAIEAIKAEHTAELASFKTKTEELEARITEWEPRLKEADKLKTELSNKKLEDKFVQFGCDPKAKADVRLLAQNRGLLTDAEGKPVDITEEVANTVKEALSPLWGTPQPNPRSGGGATAPGKQTADPANKPKFVDGKMHLTIR